MQAKVFFSEGQRLIYFRKINLVDYFIRGIFFFFVKEPFGFRSFQTSELGCFLSILKRKKVNLIYRRIPFPVSSFPSSYLTFAACFLSHIRRKFSREFFFFYGGNYCHALSIFQLDRLLRKIDLSTSKNVIFSSKIFECLYGWKWVGEKKNF